MTALIIVYSLIVLTLGIFTGSILKDIKKREKKVKIDHLPLSGLPVYRNNIHPPTPKDKRLRIRYNPKMDCYDVYTHDGIELKGIKMLMITNNTLQQKTN